MKTIDLSRGSVLVTGGGGSIGGAIAREAARAGAEVAVCDYSVSDAQQAVAEIESEGGRALAIEVDVTSTESLEHAVTTAATNLGPLIGLVTAAGILRTGSINSQDLESWRELMAVNVDGTFLAIQAAQNHLERNQGAIVTLGSVSAHIGSEDGIAYTTSKGAVHSMTYATAGNLAPKGIRVNAVCPGWVDGGVLPIGLWQQWSTLSPFGTRHDKCTISAGWQPPKMWQMRRSGSFRTTPLSSPAPVCTSTVAT